MNIFVLDTKPETAAIYLCDKHVVKMALESAQILSTVSHLRGIEAPYKPTHINHPVVIWANSAFGNYKWLIKHAIGICLEYEIRYNKTHKCEEIIKWCWLHGGKPKVDVLTSFAQCMPNQYKCKSAVKAYRNYYIGEKSAFATWKNREKPHWWTR